MTAIRERVAAPDSDDDMRLFDAVRLEYVATHRHREHAATLSISANRAGLRAVLAARADRERHPGGHDHTDLALTTDADHKRQLVAAGWTPLGVCGPAYVLRPPSTDQPTPVDGAL